MSSLNQIEMVLKKSTQELVSNEYVIEDNSDVPNDFLSLYPENAGYYNAFSKARISNFSFGCINVIKGAQRISSIPYFLTHFKLNTMLDDGFLKKILGWVSFKIVCVGHPSCDIGRIDGSVDSKVLSLVNEYIGKKSVYYCLQRF